MTTKRTPISRKELAKMPKGSIIYDIPFKDAVKLTLSHVTEDKVFCLDQDRELYDRDTDGLIGFASGSNPFYYPFPEELA